VHAYRTKTGKREAEGKAGKKKRQNKPLKRGAQWGVRTPGISKEQKPKKKRWKEEKKLGPDKNKKVASYLQPIGLVHGKWKNPEPRKQHDCRSQKK